MTVDMIDRAAALSGSARSEVTSTPKVGETTTITGTAAADSSDGSVLVELADDVTLADDEPADPEHPLAVEVPTTVDVREGDEVTVTLVGGGGDFAKAPTVTGVAAGGDRTREEVQQAAQDATNAAEMAGEVAAVATATNQHFFSDAGGVHVTTDESDAAGGSNVLLNASGMVLRSSETTLAAFTPSGVSVYDGAGSDAANVVASFSSKGVELGAPGSRQRVRMTSDRLNFVSDGEVVAHVSGAELGIANAAVTQSLAIGSLAFVPRINGHTSLMVMG